MTIDTTNMCSHLQKKLFESEGVYYPIWQAMQDDETLTAVVRSRQLHQPVAYGYVFPWCGFV